MPVQVRDVKVIRDVVQIPTNEHVATGRARIRRRSIAKSATRPRGQAPFASSHAIVCDSYPIAPKESINSNK